MATIFTLAGLDPPAPSGVMGEFVTRCPKCLERYGSPDPGQHLGLNYRKGLFNCLRCGYSGRLDIDLLEVEGQGSPSIEENTVTISSLTDLDTIPPRDIPGYTPLLADTSLTSVECQSYLQARGILWPVEAGYSGEFPGEILFPFKWGGKVIYYAARDIWGRDRASWRFPPRAQGWVGSKSVLYQLDQIQAGGVLVIVEGILDALICPCAVATQGKNVSQAQESLIVARKPRVVLVLQDSDVSQAQQSSLAERFRRQGLVSEVVKGLPKGHDPCSAGRKLCTRLIRRTLQAL